MKHTTADFVGFDIECMPAVSGPMTLRDLQRREMISTKSPELMENIYRFACATKKLIEKARQQDASALPPAAKTPVQAAARANASVEREEALIMKELSKLSGGRRTECQIRQCEFLCNLLVTLRTGELKRIRETWSESAPLKGISYTLLPLLGVLATQPLDVYIAKRLNLIKLSLHESLKTKQKTRHQQQKGSELASYLKHHNRRFKAMAAVKKGLRSGCLASDRATKQLLDMCNAFTRPGQVARDSAV